MDGLYLVIFYPERDTLTLLKKTLQLKISHQPRPLYSQGNVGVAQMHRTPSLLRVRQLTVTMISVVTISVMGNVDWRTVTASADT